MKEDRRKRLVILVMAVLFGLGLASIPVFSMPTAPSGTITVCQAGPPACDYQTIQAGIDAANAGDMVIVSSGTYSGQLALKSGVIIQSASGLDVVTVTASSSPIVFANGVVSTVVQGITVVGQEAITSVIGLELADSELTLLECVVRDIYGADSDGQSGGDAIALRSVRSVLTVTGSTIEDIGGGDGFCGESCGGDGGGAWGIWADGGRVVISETIIHNIAGGGMGCDGVGGRAVGVQVQDVDLTVGYSELTMVMGGSWDWSLPFDYSYIGGEALGIQAYEGRVVINEMIIDSISGGNGYAWGASSYLAGRAIGVDVLSADLTIEHSELGRVVSGITSVTGPCSSWARKGAEAVVQAERGTVMLRANLFLFSGGYSGNGSLRYVIHTSYTTGTYIEGNVIVPAGSYAVCSSVTSFGARQGSSMVPCPPPQGGTMVGIASEWDVWLRVEDNSVTGLVSLKRGGKAVGIMAKNVGHVALARNIVRGISGGYDADDNAAGIWIEGAKSAELDANVIGKIRGEKSGAGMCSYGLEGGGAVGITLIATGDTAIVNNAVWSVTGGNGNSGEYEENHDGGDATALHIVDTLAGVWNNTFYQTTGGAAGEPGGQVGDAVGLSVAGGADVLAVNNIIVGHNVGISSTISSALLLQYNDLWNNEINYVGVFSGVGDLHVDPGFEGAEFGDFHLVSSSLLIDAGTNVGAPVEDFEGDIRPLDGDNDGFARADIGADEHWPTLVSSKTVYPAIVEPGDVLTYQLTFSNPSIYDRPSVTLTDTVPDGTTYISGALYATAGSWGYLGDVVTWTGSLGVGEAVTLAFSVKVDGDLVGPYAIVNQAELNDHIGETQIMQATALVNPLRWYFPLAEARGW